ncbi:MAG: polysaccharide deacetylase family protein [Myxococcota bacterium]|nr:polysaccharide deacetylase family protein [Myxococcota bacterium]
MTRPTASLGVDVDGLKHYYRIHGLNENDASDAVWTIAVPRFVELFARFDVQATFYCIAEDLEVDENVERVRALVRQGHEIGNHSLTHPYDLTRLSAEAMAREVAESRAILSAASGFNVVGFRAPGYTTNQQLIAAVMASGHRYDTSVFPCGPYYLAKAAVMGGMRLLGRQSESILGPPAVLLADRDPYEMDLAHPYRHRSGGPPQFPISVCAGCPLIGTAFSTLGPSMSRWLIRLACRRRQHLTIEFHGLDLLELATDDLDPALRAQYDLGISLRRKRASFSAVIETLTRYARIIRLDALVDSVEKKGQQ